MSKTRFTDEYSGLIEAYPSAVQFQLHELFESVISVIDSNNLVSILFIGSGSRNELSIKKMEEGYDLFSDYEFVIIVNKTFYLRYHYTVICFINKFLTWFE